MVGKLRFYHQLRARNSRSFLKAGAANILSWFDLRKQEGLNQSKSKPKYIIIACVCLRVCVQHGKFTIGCWFQFHFTFHDHVNPGILG